LLWLLAARKKKLLQSHQLLLKRLLQPPTQSSSLQLLTQPSLQLLTRLLLPLRRLLMLLLPHRPLHRRLLTLPQPPSNFLGLEDRPAGRFFFACVFTGRLPA
jgi:hypothetical protein